MASSFTPNDTGCHRVCSGEVGAETASHFGQRHPAREDGDHHIVGGGCLAVGMHAEAPQQIVERGFHRGPRDGVIAAEEPAQDMEEPAPTGSWVTRRRRLASIGGGGSGGGDRYPVKRGATFPWREVADPSSGPSGHPRTPCGERGLVKLLRGAREPSGEPAHCRPRRRREVARRSVLLR